ncbi:MAG: four-helix bundle copper-binding protein [Luteolibacter sp.]
MNTTHSGYSACIAACNACADACDHCSSSLSLRGGGANDGKLHCR